MTTNLRVTVDVKLDVAKTLAALATILLIFFG